MSIQQHRKKLIPNSGEIVSQGLRTGAGKICRERTLERLGDRINMKLLNAARLKEKRKKRKDKK